MVAMKVYVVYLDGEREFASDKWMEAKARFQQLKNGLGEDRVKMTVEYI
jgi:hypothetical protein